MKQVPMKFKGYSWHHNPREIVFENTKQLNETLIALSSSRSCLRCSARAAAEF